MENAPYSRAEVLAAGSKLPERGPLCHYCKYHIPQFADLSEDDESRIRSLGLDRPILAIAQLRSVTGCDLMWARLWVDHGGRPHPDVACPYRGIPPEEAAQCPYCGRPLRTSSSKQCRFCRKDWHDPDDLRTLGQSSRTV